MPSISFRDLRALALQATDLGITGTVSAVPGPTTVEASDRPEESQFWVGAWLLVETPTSDQTARVVGWDLSTHQLSLDRALSGVLAGQRYLIWKWLQPVQLQNTLQMAIRESWPLFSPPVMKEVNISATQFRYDLGPELDVGSVYRVELEPWDSLPGMPWTVIDDWRLYGDGSAIELPRAIVWNYAGRKLRMWGSSPMPALGPTTTLTYDAPGDEALWAQFLAGSLMLQAAQVWAAQRIGDDGTGERSRSVLQMGMLMRQQALEPLKMRRRHLVHRRLAFWRL